jgi:hypothetical protein
MVPGSSSNSSSSSIRAESVCVWGAWNLMMVGVHCHPEAAAAPGVTGCEALAGWGYLQSIAVAAGQGMQISAAAVAAAAAAGAFLVAAGAIAGAGAQCSERLCTCHDIGQCGWLALLLRRKHLSCGVSCGGDNLRTLYTSHSNVDHIMSSSEDLCPIGGIGIVWECTCCGPTPPVALCPQHCLRPGSGVCKGGGVCRVSAVVHCICWQQPLCVQCVYRAVCTVFHRTI